MGRRDFTVNAIARRLRRASSSTRSAASRDLERRELRTVAAGQLPRGPAAHPPRAPARLAARLHARAARRVAQMRARGRAGFATSRRERIGGGARGRRDGGALEAPPRQLGPRTRCGSRATRARSSRSIPEFGPGDRLRPRIAATAGHARRAPVRGRPAGGRRRRGAQRSPLPALLHDLGEAGAGADGAEPRASSAPRSPAASSGACATRTRFATRSCGSSRATPSTRRADRRRLRAALPRRRTASIGARGLLLHKRADLAVKRVEAVGARRTSRVLERRARGGSGTARTASPTLRSTDATSSRSATGRDRRSAPRSRACSTSVIDDPAANEREHAPRARARGARVNAATVRERYLRRPRARPAPDVTVVAATKYVSLDELGRPRRGRGGGRRREPRAGPRGEARRLRRRVPLALHRPPPVEQGRGRRTGSASSSTRSTPTRPPGGSRSRRCSRSTSPARPRRRASRPTRSPSWLERVPVDSRPDDDAAARRRPRGVAARGSGACASSRTAHGLGELSMGTSQDWRVAVEEGATLIRVGSTLFR